MRWLLNNQQHNALQDGTPDQHEKAAVGPTLLFHGCAATNFCDVKLYLEVESTILDGGFLETACRLLAKERQRIQSACMRRLDRDLKGGLYPTLVRPTPLPRKPKPEMGGILRLWLGMRNITNKCRRDAWKKSILMV